MEHAAANMWDVELYSVVQKLLYITIINCVHFIEKKSKRIPMAVNEMPTI